MRPLFWLPITVLSLALLLPTTSWGQSAEEEEAQSRLEEAKKEMARKNMFSLQHLSSKYSSVLVGLFAVHMMN